MIKFKIDNRTLQLLNAQVNLTETFNHTLRSMPKRDALSFRLKVERNTFDTHFTVELGSERHTLTLKNEKKMHLKLADFIEEIVNGPFDTSSAADLLNQPHAGRQYARFDIEHEQQVLELVRTGGIASLNMVLSSPSTSPGIALKPALVSPPS